MPLYRPSKAELTSFCRGMYEMYSYGSKVKPDVVVFPLRGAYPFSAAYKKIAELNHESTPDILLMPLGTYSNCRTKKFGGLNKPEKSYVVQSWLKDYFSKKPNSRKILLIDEVMNGGTLITHYHMLNNYLKNNVPEAELKTCSIEHGQKEPRGKYKNYASRYNFKRVKVNSLFVMDREQFLPKITRNGDFSIEIEEVKLDDILEEIEKMHQ